MVRSIPLNYRSKLDRQLNTTEEICRTSRSGSITQQQLDLSINSSRLAKNKLTRIASTQSVSLDTPQYRPYVSPKVTGDVDGIIAVASIDFIPNAIHRPTHLGNFIVATGSARSQISLTGLSD
jgi:hypothetical protein